VIQQLAERDFPFRGRGCNRPSRLVVGRHHDRVREFREHRLDRGIERDLALFNELQGRDLAQQVNTANSQEVGRTRRTLVISFVWLHSQNTESSSIAPLAGSSTSFVPTVFM
jgi:hypothetical protein